MRVGHLRSEFQRLTDYAQEVYGREADTLLGLSGPARGFSTCVCPPGTPQGNDRECSEKTPDGIIAEC